MVKPTVVLSFVVFIYLALTANVSPQPLDEPSPSHAFIKPKANVMRRLNPLKLLFNVAHRPDQSPPYSIEWNLGFLKTMLVESAHVTEADKKFFLSKFMANEKTYAHWSPEQREQLERFTEKYFNLYKSPEEFLPFQDCSALTFAITDEILNDLHPNIAEQKRSLIRGKAAARMCDTTE